MVTCLEEHIALIKNGAKCIVGTRVILENGDGLVALSAEFPKPEVAGEATDLARRERDQATAVHLHTTCKGRGLALARIDGRKKREIRAQRVKARRNRFTAFGGSLKVNYVDLHRRENTRRRDAA